MAQDVDIAAVERTIAEHGIDTVEIAFPDTWGHMRGKRVPAAQFVRSAAAKGFACADAAFVFDIRGDIVETPYINMSTGYGDMQVVPQLDTFQAATWREGLGIVFADCISHVTHEPHMLSPRSVLRAQVDRLAALGYEALVATELEFYFTTPGYEPVTDAIQCYSLSDLLEVEPALREIRQTLDAFGIVVEASNLEYGPGQIEINLGPRDPVTAADLTMLFKHVVKEISQRHGMRATFMAKPFAGQSGNGMHIHASLQQDGENAFAKVEDDGLFRNGTMRRWLGGMLAHTPAMTAISLPTINGYKRNVAYSFAPTHVTWGRDNRGVALRCLDGIGAATRIEFRGAAADANAHTLVAAALAAGMDGLAQEREIPAKLDGDVYADPGEAAALPASLDEAVAVFAASPLAAALGAEFSDNLAVILRNESTAFQNVVTGWERERYAKYA